MLTGKKILLGVTGSIAAYKSALLIRELIKLDATVKVVMTPASREFISPLTLATLSKQPVAVDFVKPEKHGQAGEWENHVDLALWADLMILAPLSASTLSKMVAGQVDNLLMATYLSSKCPVWVAPAMDLDMYRHFSTQENLTKLKAKNVHVLEADHGELASGLEGQGRMQEPAEIARQVDLFFNKPSKLRGKKILITGGPTYEAIDPVRFIGNHSSGKTGVILADACADRGADVLLILGPSKQKVKNPRVKVISVTSADDMMRAVEQNWFDQDLGIFSAAVADYRPENPSVEKIKKSDDRVVLNLVKNPDILKWAGLNRNRNQFIVGFALETENELANAQSKLEAKRANLLVLNSLKDNGAGFGHDTNKVAIIRPNNKIVNFELSQKTALMNSLLDEIEQDLK